MLCTSSINATCLGYAFLSVAIGRLKYYKSNRSFQEVYDIEKFVKSLDGIVNVAREQPAEITSKMPAIVRVPNRVTEDYIAEHIEPRVTQKGILRLSTFVPSVNMRIRETQKEMDSVACLAMFATLELQPEIHEVVDSMIERLRTLSRRSEGRFIAVDLRVDILQKKGCKDGGSAGSKNCYSAQEIGVFLRKIGFGKDTTVYLTQSRWDESLNALKDLFPKTYTKVRSIFHFYSSVKLDFQPNRKGLFLAK